MAAGQGQAVMGVPGRVEEGVPGRAEAGAQGEAVMGARGPVVAGVLGPVRGQDRVMGGARGQTVVQDQGQDPVMTAAAEAAEELVVAHLATMQEEEQEPGAPEPVGQGGPGQALDLVPLAILQLSG